MKPFSMPINLTDDARINAVGIGPLGVEMVHDLSRNLPAITCHEVIINPKGESSEQMTALLSLVREGDLLFILTGFDDEYCEAIARVVGQSAREAGVLTLAVIPDEACCFVELAESVDTVFSVSDYSMDDEHISFLALKGALTGYSMCHMVTAISNLINQRSFIGVDFADIVTIMRKGGVGRLGVGVASGPTKGRNAAMLAMERLTSQGVATLDATGVLVIAQGSSLFTTEVFNDVSRVIYDHVAEGAKMIVGFVTDAQLGENIRVSVMAVQ